MSSSEKPKGPSSKIRPVCVVGGQRTPFCRQLTNYAKLDHVELLGASLKSLVNKFELRDQLIGEVALGTVFDHPSVWNLAREAVFDSGLSYETPAIGVQRACATSLDATINIANKIALGQIESGIAGGVENLSNPAIFYRANLARRFVLTSRAKSIGEKISIWKGLNLGDLKPGTPGVVERTTHMNMGQHCERMVKQWKISRQEQDVIALASHKNAAAAYDRGFFDDLVFEFQGIKRDNTLRGDTTAEKLAKLKPVFDSSRDGTLTAGNSSPLTDGSACVLLCSEEWAKEHKFEVLAHLRAHEVAAVDIQKEGLLMAPAWAVPRMLKREELELQDFDFYEIHEAFAGQVACTLKAWESKEFCQDKVGRADALGSIDRAKLNVVGGSIALGHPFGATGARLVATMAKLLSEKGSGRGLLSVCTGGGMGTVAVLER